ncbi:MAG TPA: hypothetical protein VJ806_00480 [Luteimonas sp.]|nr:hypothetical protein [Luteimonas sp.]
MANSEHLHDQIARATSRLAQLKARELITRHRETVRARETARRAEAAKRRRLSSLVFAAGCEDLPDGEIVAALLNYREGTRDLERRAQARAQGDAHLVAIEAAGAPRVH